MNENKLVGFDPQIFKEQKQVVEAIISDSEEEIEFEENIENMLDYLETEDESEDVEEDGKQEE